MTRVKSVAAALSLAALVVAATSVAAQQTNTSERTFLTFSSAVEMPGVTLPAGTYVFKLADTPTRNVVQVWDRDEKNMIGHWLFVQAERPEVTNENVVMFRETREGATPAVQYWYFPGERIGKEFLYPRDQAQQIAARTGQDVRTEEGVVEGGGIASVENAPAAQSADAAQSASSTQDTSAAAQPSAPAGSLAGNRGAQAEPAPEAPAAVSAQADTQVEREPAPVAQADVTPEPAAPRQEVGTSGQADTQVARADELPRTASPLALSGLLGLLSLAGAAGIRASRR